MKSNEFRWTNGENDEDYVIEYIRTRGGLH